MINTAQDMRETVVREIVCAMAPVVESIQLQMLEGAVRGALRGMILERERTELSTELDTTEYMLQCFAANKKLEGCQPATIDQYLRTARRFFTMAGKGYRQATKDDIKYYLAIRTGQISANTLVNEKRNLSSVFGWLHDEGHIEQNPVKSVKLRGEDVEIISFSMEEEIAIRDVQCSGRDKALIAFLLSTGVRVGEAVSLNRVNVDMIQGSVTFRGEKSRKGKFRTVYLDQYAKRYLGMYLASRTDQNPALFASERLYGGEPRRIGCAAMEKITKRICREAGVTRKGTVHVFRRTFATRLAERGCPIEIIQELMGHADAGTTLKSYIAKGKSRTLKEWQKYVYVA